MLDAEGKPKLQYRVRYGRPTKYRNKRIMKNGKWYDSKQEGRHADTLDRLVTEGTISSYREQVRFDLFAKNGTKVGEHKVDYLLEYPDGSQEVNEVKSPMTASLDVFKLKHKIFMDNYPEIDYIIIMN